MRAREAPPRLVVERLPGRVRYRKAPRRPALGLLGALAALLGAAFFVTVGGLAGALPAAALLLMAAAVGLPAATEAVHELGPDGLAWRRTLLGRPLRAATWPLAGARVRLAARGAAWDVDVVLGDGAAATLATVADEAEARMLAREAAAVARLPLAAVLEPEL